MKIPALVLFVVALLLAFSGCGLTPAKEYRLAAVMYNVGSVGITAAHLKGDLQGKAYSGALEVQGRAKQRLADARQWLTDNPTLANVPGTPFPPLDPLNISLEELARYTIGIDLVPINPPAPTPPTTQP